MIQNILKNNMEFHHNTLNNQIYGTNFLTFSSSSEILGPSRISWIILPYKANIILGLEVALNF